MQPSLPATLGRLRKAMLGIENYGVFIVTGVLLNMTPGQDAVYIVARSAQGLRAGLMSVYGIAVGCAVHAAAATFGLSLVIASSALVFNVIKYIGAFYLIYLGIRMIFSSTKLEHSNDIVQRNDSSRDIFYQGLITNILNPKVALFFLAFLPQFVDSAAESPRLSFMILGLTFILTGTTWNTLLAIMSAKGAKLLFSAF